MCDNKGLRVEEFDRERLSSLRRAQHIIEAGDSSE
jgi:hypothetical protein